MAYPIPTQEQIRDGILRDQRNLNPEEDITEDSDNWIKASGDASAIQGLYQYMQWGVNQFFPDTAALENLVRHASARNIPQVPATSAVGLIKFTADPGTPIPAGTVVQVDGVQYQNTVAGATDGTGTATLDGIALIVGPGGNQPDNTPGVLMAAPAGIEPNVVLVQMNGGVDAESMDSLLGKVLDRLRQPPAGGNKFDYARWAREVAGVTTAYSYPKRRGVGSVDVAVLSNGVPASAPLCAAVEDYINNAMPVHVDFMALSPQLVVVPVTATVVLAADALMPTVQSDAEKALAAYFATLKPGDTAIRSRIATIIGDIAGVVDYNVTAPAANVTTIVDATHIEMPSLGVVTLGV